MVTVLRPLSTSELLDRTFHLYRNNFLVFVGIAGIPQLFVLPWTLGGAVMLAHIRTTTPILIILTGYFFFYVALLISQPPIIAAVSSLHLEKPISIRSAYAESRRGLVRVIWIVFLLCLGVFGFFALAGGLITAGVTAVASIADPVLITATSIVLIVPVAILALRLILNWSLVLPVAILEGSWFRASIRCRKHLATGTRWRILGVVLLMTVFGGIVAITIEFLLLFSVGMLQLHDVEKVQVAIQAVQAISIFLSASLISALGTIALCLIYFDQRVRKEGFDMQLMMATMRPVTQDRPVIST